MLIFSVLVAIVPAVLLTTHLYRIDRKRSVSGNLILKTFLAGFFSVLPAGALEVWLVSLLEGLPETIANFVEAFLIIALVEEGIKLLVVSLLLSCRREHSVTGAITCTITASMGFACLENLMYSFGSPITIVIRGVTAVPLHAVASGVMGYGVGLAGREGGARYRVTGFIWAVVIHGLYDLLLLTGGLWSIVVLPLLLFSGITVVRLHRRAIELDDPNETSLPPPTERVAG